MSVDGRVGTVTLNRPASLNALTVELVDELRSALGMLAGSTAVRCIVLTGAGRAFCAGADLSVLKDIGRRRDADLGARLVDGARGVFRAIREAPQPVLCALNGAAAGGGANLALACDLRIAADTAAIGQVFARLGLHPDWGGTWFLPRLVGASKALELFLDAEMVDAARCLELGLVNRVVPAAELPARSREWAERIAAAPPEAVRRLKRSLYAGEAEGASLETTLDRELEAQLACFATKDFAEGLSAFFEKREPHFTGQ